MTRTLVVVRHVVQSLFTKSCIIFRFANKFDTIPYVFFFVEYIPNTILNRLPLYKLYRVEHCRKARVRINLLPLVKY